MRAASVILLSLTLAACARDGRIEFPAAPVTLGDFVQQIKHEVGAFEQAKGARPAQGRCAKDFDLQTSSVTVTVTTVNTRTQTGEISVEIPLGTGSIGPSASGTRAISGSQTISFTVLPQPLEGDASQHNVAPASARFEGTPLKDALLALYGGLVENSDYHPCLAFGSEDEQENSIDYGFKVEESRSAGGKIKLYLFTLDASDKAERSIENTLKVDFVFKGVSVIN